MKASADLEYHFYDATTDLGVPTIYSLQIAPYHKSVRTLVACTTGLTIVDALCKSIRDMTALKLAFRREHTIPNSWDDFTDPLHGATFMARAENAGAFDFLTGDSSRKMLSEMQASQTVEGAITEIIGRLWQEKLHTYVVDLSTDEAIRAGMRVVRVLIPGLQPLSLRYRARYLGHPRLYTAPASMGYLAHLEENLNHWPQPFA
jgi:ribosomal protein S12 methylthiotransferase accessory factor